MLSNLAPTGRTPQRILDLDHPGDMPTLSFGRFMAVCSTLIRLIRHRNNILDLDHLDCMLECKLHNLHPL